MRLKNFSGFRGSKQGRENFLLQNFNSMMKGVAGCSTTNLSTKTYFEARITPCKSIVYDLIITLTFIELSMCAQLKQHVTKHVVEKHDQFRSMILCSIHLWSSSSTLKQDLSPICHFQHLTSIDHTLRYQDVDIWQFFFVNDNSDNDKTDYFTS